MRFIVSVFFLLSLLPAQSQPRLVSQSLTDTSKALLYIGVDNEFHLVDPSGKINGYTVTANGAECEVTSFAPERKGEYIISPKTAGDCKLAIWKNDKKVWERMYKAATITSNFQAMAGGLYNNTAITKTSLLLNPFVSVVFTGCYWDHHIAITSFTLTVPVGDDTVSIKTMGNRFTAEQIQRIKALPTGSTIRFEDIRATGPSYFCNRKFPSFWIKLQ